MEDILAYKRYIMKKKIILSIIILIIVGIIIYRKTYVPSDKKIFSEGSGITNKDETFIENQIFITFKSDTDFKKIKRIVWKLNGTIDGTEENSINMYAITLNNKRFNNIEEIENYCNKITKKYNQIEDCSQNEIIKIPDCSKEPC